MGHDCKTCGDRNCDCPADSSGFRCESCSFCARDHRDREREYYAGLERAYYDDLAQQQEQEYLDSLKTEAEVK